MGHPATEQYKGRGPGPVFDAMIISGHNQTIKLDPWRRQGWLKLQAKKCSNLHQLSPVSCTPDF